MTRKVLFLATIDKHFAGFHLPYFAWFKTMGYEVHTAANQHQPLAGADVQHTIAVSRSPFSRGNLRAYRQLKAILTANEYELIHCHTPLGGVLGRLAARAARKRGTKVVYTAHGFHFCKGAPLLNWLVYYPIERLLAYWTDVLITINEEDYRLALGHRFRAGAIEHVPGVGVDAARFEPATEERKRELRRELGYDEDAFLLFGAAEFNRNKNQEALIRALGLIGGAAPNMRLLLAGDGPLLPELKRLSEELGVRERVDFLGERRDIDRLLPICDAAVAASFREGLPVNILEAMACGLPVVASANRGHRELIRDDENGWLVDATDSEGFARRLLALYREPLTRRRMGAAGRSRIEYRYALPLVLIRMAGIYKRHLPVGQAVDEQTTDKQTAIGQIADKQTAARQTTVGLTAVRSIADKQAVAGQSAVGLSADRHTAVGQTADKQTAPTGVQRVLHVAVNLNRGGAETLLMNLYRNVDRTRVQFDFLTCKPGVYDEEIVAMGGVVHRIPYLTEVGHGGFVRELRAFFREHPDYTLVHSHLDKMSGLVLAAARREGVPIRIAHSHNTASEGGAPARLYKWAVGLSIRRSATHRMACSQAAAEWLFSRRAEDALVLKNGIEIARFRHRETLHEEVRRELAIPAGAFVIGHVGRFAPVKNHSWLLELYRRFRAEHPTALLLLCGDGPLLAQTQEQAARAGLTGEHIRFLGSRSDVDRLLQAMDVFIFPSLHEGLPVVLIEAQGAALPCLVSTAVSPECDLGLDLVRRLPLADQTAWLGELQQLAASRKPRTTQAMSIAAAGYDIRRTARWLTDYYLTITQGRNRDEEADCLYTDVQPRLLPGSVLRKPGAANLQRVHLAGDRRRLHGQYPRAGRAVGSRSED